jgi:hypothetical protein
VTNGSTRLILDTSAVAAYGRGSIDVAETIGEVSSEGAVFGIPTICLAEAVMAAKSDELTLIDLLTDHASCHEILLTDDWRGLGLGARVFGSLSTAEVRALAVEHRAYILTADPATYGELPTIGI